MSQQPQTPWSPQVYQPAPGTEVQQWTEFAYAEHVVVHPDGRTSLEYGASWRYLTTDARYMPSAARAPLVCPVGLVRPAILIRPTDTQAQLPWTPGASTPRQLALPESASWWRRLLT